MEKKPRSYHHGDLKTALIQAALQMVRRKGARGFTLNEASRAAGVSVSAPYNHFKDKEGLMIEIVMLGNRTLNFELRAAADGAGTAREKLRAVFHGYLEFARKHPDLFAVMFQSGIDKTLYPEVGTTAKAAFAVAEELAAQMEPSAGKAQELALAVWTMAHGFATLAAEGAFANVGGARSAWADLLVGRLLAG